MNSPLRILYSPLQWLARATFRRDFGREIARQRIRRTANPARVWEQSFEQAVDFANRMAKASPAYRRKLEENGVLLPISSDPRVWRQMPTLTKEDFRRDSDDWYVVKGRETKVFWTWTSGSTGEPFKYPLSAESHVAEVVSEDLSLRALGWKPWWRPATIKVEPKKPHGLRGWVRTVMGNQPIGFAAAEFRMEQVPDIVNQLRENHVRLLRGYSTSVFLLADEMKRLNLSAAIPLITAFGEALTDKQADIVERVFGGKVYRDYGGSEAMHVGYQCREQSGYHVDLTRFYVEIMQSDRVLGAGERGEIVVTHFKNDAMPLIRYRMGDIGEWMASETPCPCGNRMPMFLVHSGRTTDAFVTPTGHVMNVPLLVVVFEYAQEHISQFKIIQTDSTRFDVLWVARHDKAGDFLPPLEEELIEKTGGSLLFTWKQVSEILPEPSGKRKILQLLVS